MQREDALIKKKKDEDGEEKKRRHHPHQATAVASNAKLNVIVKDIKIKKMLVYFEEMIVGDIKIKESLLYSELY